MKNFTRLLPARQSSIKNGGSPAESSMEPAPDAALSCFDDCGVSKLPLLTQLKSPIVYCYGILSSPTRFRKTISKVRLGGFMYRILCDRTPARELCSGLTWFMEDGKIVEFSTLEEAGAMVKTLSEGPRAATVKYTAKEFNLE